MKTGDLMFWWIPQVPMKPFHYPVQSPEEAALLYDAFAKYDLFQLEHNVKPDYCNAGGLLVWEEDVEPNARGEKWIDWHFEDNANYIDMDFEEWVYQVFMKGRDR